MSRQEPLPDGQFVVLRDAKELRGRDRELIMASALSAQSIFERVPEEERDPKPGETDAERNTRLNAWIAATPLSIEESLALMGLRRAALVAQLESWSFSEPLPTISTVGDLPADRYDALLALIAPDSLMELTGTTDFSPTPDQESPTSGSTSSVEPSVDSPDSPSTPELPDVIESTATEVSTPG